jgi:hypothetical protein
MRVLARGALFALTFVTKYARLLPGIGYRPLANGVQRARAIVAILAECFRD